MRLLICLLNKFNIYLITCLLVLQAESKLFGENVHWFPTVSTVVVLHSLESTAKFLITSGEQGQSLVDLLKMRFYKGSNKKQKIWSAQATYLCLPCTSSERPSGQVLSLIKVTIHQTSDAEIREETFFPEGKPFSIIRMDKIQLQGSMCSCKDVYFPAQILLPLGEQSC